MAERIASHMDVPITVLGLIFILLALADTVSGDRGRWGAAFETAIWLVWAVFAFEFVLRTIVAPSTWAFLRRNWWQLAFLVVPFLRFLRVAASVKTARAGRVVSAAVRGTRTAVRTLSGRLAWLSAVTVIVVLTASQLLYEFGHYSSYGRALRAAALATVTGEPTQGGTAVADVLDVVLAVYSVAVFAAVAAMLGAYFIEHDRGPDEP
jgi:voltage-gated potassium channel